MLTIQDIWKAIDDKKIVNWHHQDYVVKQEKVNLHCEYQNNHFSNRKGKILVITHNNGSTSILHKENLKDIKIN